MTNKKTLKTLVFSLGLAVMTLAVNNLNAQNRNGGGLFGMGQTPDNTDNGNRGLLNVSADVESGITNSGIGEQAPLGSGLVILLGAGLGYVALKKKED